MTQSTKTISPLRQRMIDDMTLDEDAFLRDELVQDAVIRNIEVVGEASRNIDKHYPEFTEQHVDVPFSMAYEMRNALSHGYFRVDLELVWKTIERDLPAFEAMITRLKTDLNG